MGNRYEYPQKNSTGLVTNDDASLMLIANPGLTMFVNIININISVYEAAAGGGGVLEIKDTNGGIIYKMNVDGVKDFNLDWGEEGLKVGPNVGVQATVSGAQTKQASVSVSIAGHVSFR